METKNSYSQASSEFLRSENVKLQRQLERAERESRACHSKIKELSILLQNKQNVATRLLIQRNSAKFLNKRVDLLIRNTLKMTSSSVGKGATIHDMVDALLEVFNFTYQKYDKVVQEKLTLISQNEGLKFRIQELESQLKTVGKNDFPQKNNNTIKIKNIKSRSKPVGNSVIFEKLVESEEFKKANKGEDALSDLW